MSFHAVDWFTVGGSVASAGAIIVSLIVFWIQRKNEIKNKKNEVAREVFSMRVIAGTEAYSTLCLISFLVDLHNRVKVAERVSVESGFYGVRIIFVIGGKNKPLLSPQLPNNFEHSTLIMAAKPNLIEPLFPHIKNIDHDISHLNGIFNYCISLASDNNILKLDNLLEYVIGNKVDKEKSAIKKIYNDICEFRNEMIPIDGFEKINSKVKTHIETIIGV